MTEGRRVPHPTTQSTMTTTAPTAAPSTAEAPATAVAATAVAATETPRTTYERIFDARRLVGCLDCLRRTADHPPPLPGWFLGRHAEKHAADEAGVDEVAALAAGRRPCSDCRPDAAMAFAEAWARGNGLAVPPSFEEIDAMLAREGITGEGDGLPCWVAFVDTLPDGAVVIDEAVSPTPQAILGEAMLPWSGAGWGEPQPRSRERLVTLVTPPSTVMALSAGYRPGWSNDGGEHQPS